MTKLPRSEVVRADERVFVARRGARRARWRIVSFLVDLTASVGREVNGSIRAIDLVRELVGRRARELEREGVDAAVFGVVDAGGRGIRYRMLKSPDAAACRGARAPRAGRQQLLPPP